jgi:hypothetical protein
MSLEKYSKYKNKYINLKKEVDKLKLIDTELNNIIYILENSSEYQEGGSYNEYLEGGDYEYDQEGGAKEYTFDELVSELGYDNTKISTMFEQNSKDNIYGSETQKKREELKNYLITEIGINPEKLKDGSIFTDKKKLYNVLLTHYLKKNECIKNRLHQKAQHGGICWFASLMNGVILGTNMKKIIITFINNYIDNIKSNPEKYEKLLKDIEKTELSNNNFIIDINNSEEFFNFIIKILLKTLCGNGIHDRSDASLDNNDKIDRDIVKAAAVLNTIFADWSLNMNEYRYKGKISKNPGFWKELTQGGDPIENFLRFINLLNKIYYKNILKTQKGGSSASDNPEIVKAKETLLEKAKRVQEYLKKKSEKAWAYTKEKSGKAWDYTKKEASKLNTKIENLKNSLIDEEQLFIKGYNIEFVYYSGQYIHFNKMSRFIRGVKKLRHPVISAVTVAVEKMTGNKPSVSSFAKKQFKDGQAPDFITFTQLGFMDNLDETIDIGGNIYKLDHCVLSSESPPHALTGYRCNDKYFILNPWLLNHQVDWTNLSNVADNVKDGSMYVYDYIVYCKEIKEEIKCNSNVMEVITYINNIGKSTTATLNN